MVASSDSHLRLLLCRSLAHDRRFRVVAQAADGDAALACPIAFDVAVVDLSIGGFGVLEVITHLRSRQPAPAIVVISHADVLYLRDALTAEGVADYLVVADDIQGLPERLFRAGQHASQLAHQGVGLQVDRN
jgi:DNA-binding NarL/FixJ family response regulator